MSLLQGTSNMINSGLISNPVNLRHLQKFCEMLRTVLKIDLNFILLKTLSTNDIKELTKNQNPLLLFNSSSRTSQQDMIVKKLMAGLSSHPVHLTSEGATSAFIPFCAYQTDLLSLGKYIAGFELPVCNAFFPTVHRGRLCYTAQ